MLLEKGLHVQLQAHVSANGGHFEQKDKIIYIADTDWYIWFTVT